MFSVIIRDTGIIKDISKKSNNCILKILSKIRFTKSDIGSSISCSGTCLTLEKYKKNLMQFYISYETFERTNFKFLKKGDLINLEKPLKHGERNSGHFVQGHVDATSQIKKIEIIGKSWVMTFSLNKKYIKYLVTKGSVSINGVSLTISKITKTGFQIVVIPQTLKLTNLIHLKRNNVVNVEFDVLGKYIKNFLK